MSFPETLRAFQERLEPELVSAIETLSQEAKHLTTNESVHSLLAQIQKVSNDGKRIRPFLTQQTYALYTTDTETDHLTLYVALELFHIFCLIHDDIMDRAPMRHGAATIHHHLYEQHYRARTDGAHIADGQAILAGDLLFNQVYQLCMTGCHTRANQSELLAHFGQMVREVLVGQMIDIDLMYIAHPEAEVLLTKNTLKTAYYSVVRPLQLGALLAQQRTILPTLETIGVELGLMYQFQDDLFDATADASDTGKTRFIDVTQGQPTFLTNYIAGKHPGLFAELGTYAGKTLTAADIARLTTLYTDSGAIAYAEAEIKKHYDTACGHIAQLDTTAERAFFSDMIAFLYHRKK